MDNLTPADVPEPPAQSQLRVSDADREQVAWLLREHAAAGRITLAEWSSVSSRSMAPELGPSLLKCSATGPPRLVRPTTPSHGSGSYRC